MTERQTSPDSDSTLDIDAVEEIMAKSNEAFLATLQQCLLFCFKSMQKAMDMNYQMLMGYSERQQQRLRMNMVAMATLMVAVVARVRKDDKHAMEALKNVVVKLQAMCQPQPTSPSSAPPTASAASPEPVAQTVPAGQQTEQLP